MTTPLHEATEMAAATAKIAHGGVKHGDNDPEATADLLTDRAVLDRLFPPRHAPDRGRAMCAAWDDHHRARVAAAATDWAEFEMAFDEGSA